MDFALLIVATGLMLVRPGDMVPALDGTQQAYQFVLLAAVATVLARGGGIGLSGDWFTANPVTTCVVGLVPAIALSHLAQGNAERAMEGASEFAKIVVFHITLVAVLNSLGRLKAYLIWLAALIVALASFSIYQYFVSSPPTLEELAAVVKNRSWDALDGPKRTTLYEYQVDSVTGQVIWLARLGASALDPNDVCTVFILGIAVGGWRLVASRAGFLARILWVAPMLFLGWAIQLTQSRGGFLALSAAVLSALVSIARGTRAIMIAAAALAALMAAFGGRQLDIGSGIESGTGQGRIQYWSDGLNSFLAQPVFGIGEGNFIIVGNGHVAHNAYVHVLTELGVVGAACFAGAILAAWQVLAGRTSRAAAGRAGRDLAGLRPFLLAMVVGYTCGMFSLSLGYILPTYLLFGIVGAYQRLVERATGAALVRLDGAFVARLAVVLPAGIAAIFVFVSATVTWR